MTSIAVVKESIMLCREIGITLFIWGHRGIGKSSIVKQVCLENQFDFVDLRCAQLESSDIRGFPDKGDDNKTHYLPPADLPSGDTKGILFLDEINRAQDDVLHSIFQLILDKKVGQYTLPSGWSIVAAGNFTDGYMVNSFNDSAFLDRFCHIILSAGETTLSEWIDYMVSMHGDNASSVIEFASQNIKHLDGDISGGLDFSIQPSRRSWEYVVKVQMVRDKYSNDACMEVLSGLIGRELAIAFSRYSCPVRPQDIITHGLEKMLNKLKKLNRNQMVGLMWGLVSHCKQKIDDPAISNVCLDFAEFMATNSDDNDVVAAFCAALTSKMNSKLATITNPQLAKMMAQYNAKKKSSTSFIDQLNARPNLQKLLSSVTWGTDDE